MVPAWQRRSGPALIAIADQGRVPCWRRAAERPQSDAPRLCIRRSITPTISTTSPTTATTAFRPGQATTWRPASARPEPRICSPYLALFDLGPAVVSSDPAPGQVVTTTPPTTFSLTFYEPIEPSSIVASDFTVDGTSADSASLSSDGLTITYTFNTSPVVTQGLETMSCPPDR